MSTDTANISLSELQISSLLEDLKSRNVQIRQSAILQLQNFIGNERVSTALKVHRQLENNPECLAELDQIIKLSAVSSGSLQALEKQAANAAEVIRLWFSVAPSDLYALVRGARKLSAEEQARIFCGVFDRSPEPSQMLPALDLGHRGLLDDAVIDRLEKLVKSESVMLKMRTVSLLTKLRPAKLITYLPALLVDKSFQLRLLAIRALHLLSKTEATRLLNELMSSSDQGKQSSAFAFLFVLPFEDTSDILVRLIESGELAFNIDQAIRYLIFNNPDIKFFKRLTISYLLHGSRITALKSYWQLAAHSLVVSGLVKKQEEELVKDNLAAAREFIRRHTSQCDEAETAAEHRVASDLKNQELARLTGLAELNAGEVEKLQYLIRDLVAEAEIAAAIRLVGRHRLGSAPFCDWLENLIEHKSPEIVIMAVETLKQTGKSRLLAHLPVLVFHADLNVADRSRKIFAEAFPDKFIEKLKLWIRDSNSSAREIAGKGLLEIDFQQALELLIPFFRSCKKPDLIKFYGPVLLLNPDRLSIYKLNNLAAGSSGEKRKVLHQMAAAISAELSDLVRETEPSTFTSIISEESLREQWLVILEKIQKITYENQAFDFTELIRTRSANIILVGILVLAAITFIARFELKENERVMPAAIDHKEVYSYDLGAGADETVDDRTVRPWDYQLPELEMPPDSLSRIMSMEEVAAVHQELLLEAGSSVLQLPPDEVIIRLEIEQSQ